MDWSVFLSIIGGGLITIGVAVFVECFRKPRLSLKRADHEDTKWTGGYPATKARWLRLKAENKQLPRGAKWLSRNTALHCSVLITFYHLDGRDVFGRSIQARWTSLREPLSPQVVTPEGELKYSIIDPVRLSPEMHRDIYSGESEQLDVVGRFDDDEECYGWCDDNYFSNPRWKNPKWKLDKGIYLVKVTVKSSTKCCDVFRIINDVPVNDFRLEEALPKDYDKVNLSARK